MAAGPVGGCWKQTPAWSLTAWTANTWSGAGTTTSTVVPGGGSVGRSNWTARGKTKFRDGKPVVEPTPLRKSDEPTTRPVASHDPVLVPEPEIKAPTPKGFAIDATPRVIPEPEVPRMSLKEQLRLEKARQAAQEADDQAAIEHLLRIL